MFNNAVEFLHVSIKRRDSGYRYAELIQMLEQALTDAYS
jgi:hypothetical protein